MPYWGRHGNKVMETYLCLCPATVRLSFGFVKVFFVRLDFHGEDALLEFLPLCLCGRPSVVLRRAHVRGAHASKGLRTDFFQSSSTRTRMTTYGT